MGVRYESVRLDLTGDYTTKAMKAATTTAVLRREVSSLGRTAGNSDKRLDGLTQRVGSLSSMATRSRSEVAGVSREVDMMGRSFDRTNTSLERTGSLVDRTSGRLQLWAQAIAVLGPGLAPIGAVGIPALSGLAASAGFAALAGGVLTGVFQGVGDALTAVNKAALEPTEANLEAAREAMERLSPAARSFVTRMREFIPALKELRDLGAEQMFPGFEDGLDGLEKALPRVERLVETMSAELGSIAADTGESLGSERWAPFLGFLATDGPPAVRDMVTGVGNLTHAMAELWMAFDPLNDDFSTWLVDSTADLDAWAAGLDQTQGFTEFVDYVRTNGPQVADTFGSIANMGLQVVQAVAPLGGPVLQGLEAFADIVAAIADSDLGTPIFGALAAMSLYNRGLAASTAIQKRWGTQSPVVAGLERQKKTLTSLRGDWAAYTAVSNTAQGRAQASAGALMAQAQAGQRLGTSLRTAGAAVGKTAAGVGALALVTTGAADGIGLTNTASLALAGTMFGPWGAAIGASAGLLLDTGRAASDAGDAMDELNAAVDRSDFSRITDQVSAAKKQLQDLSDISGFKDLFKTIGQDIGFSLTGKTRQGEIERYQASIRAAEAAAAEQRAADGREAIARKTVVAAQLAAQGFKLTAAGAREAAMSTKEFAASLTAANAALTRQGTLDAYTTSLLDMQDALKQNGRTLDGNTRAGLANRAGMRQMASSALEYAGNMKQADRRTQFLDRARGDFIRMARALGASGPAARRMADDFGLVDRASRTGAVSAQRLAGSLRDIPKDVRTQVGEVGAARARAMIVDLTQKYNLTPRDVRTLIRESGGKPTKAMVDRIIASARTLDRTNPSSNISARDNASGVINGVKQGLNSIPRVITTHVYTRHHLVGSTAGTSANPTHNGDRGMLWTHDGVRRYAAGGLDRGDLANRHQAELARRPGLRPRVWLEEETQGEAYIPLANDDRRPRARAIAKETVGLLGGNIDWAYARGGFERYATGGTRRRRDATPNRLTAREHIAAKNAFNVGTLSVARTNKELAAFAAQIRRSGGRVGANFESLSKRIRTNAAEYAGLGKQIASLKEKVEPARQAGQGAFNNDIFTGSLADLRTRLEADRNDSNAAAAAVARARGKGLKGDFGAGLAGSGNVALAQELANVSSAEIAQLQALYAQRTTAQNSLGNQAAAAMQTSINQLAAQQRQLTAVMNTLERAVERGARNGSAQRARRTTTQSKAKGGRSR